MPAAPAIDTLTQAGLAADEARKLHGQLEALVAKKLNHEALWTDIRKTILTPKHPIAVHEALRDWAFAGWDEKKQGPRPIWRADEKRKAATNLAQILKEKKFKDYDAFYQWSLNEGREFWAMIVARLGIPFENNWKPSAENIVDLKNPREPKWFPGAKLNVANSFFTAPRDAIAIIYQKEGSDEIKRMTYGELDAYSNRIANALVKHGFKAQDRIAIDMPFNIEAVAIFVGLLKMGGTMVSLADSFKGPDLEMRIDAAKPVKCVFTQDVTGGLKSFPLYPTVAECKNAPMAVVVTKESFKPLRKGDLHFDDFIQDASDKFTAVALGGDAYCNVIFSSSTSTPKEGGDEKPKPPKAIPWTPATIIKSAVDAHLHHDMRPGKVLCWPTNLGWMMGSFAIAASLINKGTLAMFDGAPTVPAFAKFLGIAKVNMLGLVPSIAETWQKNGALEGADLSSIDLFSSTGSPSNSKNYFWLMSRVKGYVPCLEYMGGTEIGGGYLSSSFYQPFAPSCFTTPNLGTDMYLWPKDDDHGRQGEVFIAMRNGKGECPPMGLSATLLNYNHDEKYFERGLKHNGYELREHGDIVIHCPGGFYISNGRADDGMNLNGIKTSSLDLENYIKDAHIAGLKEVAAIAARPPEGGEDWLVIYAVTDGISAEQLKSPIREAIKARNPQLARVHDVVVIASLPLTASGKLRRRYLQDLYVEQLKISKAS